MYILLFYDVTQSNVYSDFLSPTLFDIFIDDFTKYLDFSKICPVKLNICFKSLFLQMLYYLYQNEGYNIVLNHWKDIVVTEFRS